MFVENLSVSVDLPSPRRTPHCHQHRQRGADHSQGILGFLKSKLVHSPLQGGLGVGLSHMILTLLVSIYFWIVVFSHR